MGHAAGVVTLHREFVPGAQAARWLLLTHGIYGSGGNWRSIARKLVATRPEWGVVLVDLRGHGRSPPGDPPHTLDACAADLAALIAELAATHPITAVAGHSFGGKVALALRATGAPVAQTWALDSSPRAQPGAWSRDANDVRDVWQLLSELPTRWARRDEFVAAVVARGQRPDLAAWLGMSLVPDGEALRLVFDLAQIHALLDDYWGRDLWASLPAHADVRLVIADRSHTWPEVDRARARSLGAPVHVHVVADAGHWLHIDAPAAVVALLAAHLP